MKKSTLFLLISMLLFALMISACGGSDPATTEGNDSAVSGTNSEDVADSNSDEVVESTGEGYSIGISMPTKSSSRWISDGESMVQFFEEKGYETDLQYAEDDIPNQLAQIENMVTKGVNVLIIAAIDGTTLSDVLQQAADQGIKVIAYDRLIRDSGNVDYYATFDNFQVGVLQASYIEEALGLADGNGPFNIELFGGSPDDNNAYFFYDGAMSVLQPYIDSEQLVVQSGQMGMDKVSTLRWDGATAQARMDNLLSAYYTDEQVDAVLSPYDGLSIGIISSLKGVGYGSDDLPMPVVTGQDAEVPSVKSILAGEQTSTVFKDTRELAKQTVAMVDALLSGGEVPVNDTETYENGVKVVPSYLLKPVSVDIDNWVEALVDTGYYTADEFADVIDVSEMESNEESSTSGEGYSIGISMPTKSSSRWISDGESMVQFFEEKGYETDLQYAEDDIPNQLAQIENMVTKGVNVLIIAAIDGTTLSDVLQQAADQGIKVIAYDRLIRDSGNVDYYATFDNFQVGVLQASYIEEALGLADGNGPFNIELFGGSPDDNNAYFFYDGAMSVLQPYIDSEQLVVQSGQMGMDKVSTLRWDGATAQARMDNLLSAYYTDEQVDAVLSPYDGLSIGIISSLKGVGYGSDDLPMPVVTGQDAEVPSVKSILAGEQTSTVFKDTRELAKQTVAMVDALLSGGEVPVNDTETYENGVKVVPSYLLKPVSVDIDNWVEALVDTGYYTADEFE